MYMPVVEAFSEQYFDHVSFLKDFEDEEATLICESETDIPSCQVTI
jgi:hypothetical protein